MLLDERRTAILVRVLPFALFIVLLAVRGQLGAGADRPFAFDLRWLYAVQAGVALALLVLWHRRFLELSELVRSMRAIALSVAAGIGVFALWVAPLPAWSRLGAPQASFVPLDAAGALRWDLVAARAAGAVLVVPLMEELFWRSFLMRWIDKRDFLRLDPAATSRFAVLASSTVFALAHDLWLAGFIAGLVFAWIYRRLGNLWYAVLAHATSNVALALWVIGRGAWSYW